MKNNNFRTMMLHALSETGMSLKELSRRSGVSYDALNKVKSREGASTSAENAKAVADVLGFEWVESLPVAASPSSVMVPIYNATASAGDGAALVAHDLIEDHLTFPAGYLREITSTSKNHLAIIRTKGDSMVPTIGEDDLVMVDTTKTDLSFDGIFVIRDDGASLLVKRIGRGTRRGYVSVISDNERYRATERALSDIEVLGKVVWMGVKV